MRVDIRWFSSMTWSTPVLLLLCEGCTRASRIPSQVSSTSRGRKRTCGGKPREAHSGILSFRSSLPCDHAQPGTLFHFFCRCCRRQASVAGGRRLPADITITVPGDGSDRTFGTTGTRDEIGRRALRDRWLGRPLPGVCGASDEGACVLKWHEAGCYTTAFAEVRAAADGSGAPAEDRDAEKQSDRLVPTAKTQPSRPSQTRRSEKATSTHWLAGGSKDGKVSLWEVY